MPAYCTCGTELLPDSLFCHKCGKPQREIQEYEPEPAVTETEAAPPPPMPPIAEPEPPPVNFHNRVAIQIGLVMAILATLASFLVYVTWPLAGFFTVLIYRRRTGYPLNLETGIRLGWITGILIFVIMTVMMTAWVALVVTRGIAGLPAEIRDDPRIQEGLRMLLSSPAVAQMVALLFAVAMLFISSTLLTMAGGALGGKLFSRSR